jgi:glutaconate CoA-transferase subunit B
VSSDITSGEWSAAEMMAVALSRELIDGEFGGCGAAAQIPMAALRLGQLTRTPNLTWFCGGSGAINPKFDRLYDSSADHRNLVRAEAQISMEDIVDFETSARFDFCFLGGMQIDKYGNVNMALIGDWARPTVRGPGSVGLVFMAGFKKVYL